MIQPERGYGRLFGVNIALRIVCYGAIVILLSNLNALVDSVLHPEIPYFDEEHLIVGSITALVTGVLFFFLIKYELRLNRILAKTLESFLPICSNCKRIRNPDMPSDQMESWQHIETYIGKKTDTNFSHGICPECVEIHYPDFHRRKVTKVTKDTKNTQ